jgi:hypothetical protein
MSEWFTTGFPGLAGPKVIEKNGNYHSMDISASPEIHSGFKFVRKSIIIASGFCYR